MEDVEVEKDVRDKLVELSLDDVKEINSILADILRRLQERIKLLEELSDDNETYIGLLEERVDNLEISFDLIHRVLDKE